MRALLVGLGVMDPCQVYHLRQNVSAPYLELEVVVHLAARRYVVLQWLLLGGEEIRAS